MQCAQLLVILQNFTEKTSVVIQDGETEALYYMDLTYVQKIDDCLFWLKVSYDYDDFSIMWTLLVRFSEAKDSYVCVFDDPIDDSTEVYFHIHVPDNN